MDFIDFVIRWWNDYLDDATDETCDKIMQEWIGEEEYVSDYIPSDAESSREWLLANVTDADAIYESHFGPQNRGHFEGMPDDQDFLIEMFSQALPRYARNTWSYMLPKFAEDFIADMAYHAQDYGNPQDFFKDLQHGGCMSGMIGMLVYNNDCKKIYIENIDDLEEFRSDLEDELGEPIRNRHNLQHYTFVCWLCYEELAADIERHLWQ